MAVDLGTIYATLGLKTDAFNRGMEQARGQITKAEGSLARLGRIGGQVSGVGTKLTMGLTAPLIGLATGAVAAAQQVEGALANIRAGTGVTGPALGRLQDDFRAVFKQVPQDASLVSAAIADLNVRLGLTGQPLRDMSLQMLELADLTGLQVEPLIASTTRVFGDWAVSTEDQSRALDKLYVASQQTGIGVDRLSEKLVQYGAPLRAMNFTMEQSAAMLGKWEQEGVNTELVLGSLRIAMGHFADEGVDMRKGLDATIQRIQRLGPGAEATSLAMEVFGARAGPDMAAAILEGRFEFEELVRAIEESPETIMEAGEETETFAEKLAMLRNRATLAVEPIGKKLVEAASQLLPHVIGLLEAVANLATRFTELPASTQRVIAIVAALAIAIGPVLTVVGKVMAALPAIKAALVVLTGPIGLVIAAVALLAAAWTQNWGGIQEKTAVAVEFVKGLIQQGLAAITAFWAEHGATIMQTLQSAWDAIVGAVTWVVETVSALWAEHGDKVLAVLALAWEQIKAVFDIALAIIEGVVKMVIAAIQGDWDAFGFALGEMIRKAWDGIVRFVTNGVAKFQLVITTLVDGVKNLFANTDWAAVGQGIIDGIVNGVRNAAVSLANAASAAAKAALAGARRALGMRSPSRVAARMVGQPFVDGIVQGIRRAMQQVNPAMLGYDQLHIQYERLQRQAPLTLDPSLWRNLMPAAQGAAQGERTTARQAPVLGQQTTHNWLDGAIRISVPGGDPDKVRESVIGALRAAGVTP